MERRKPYLPEDAFDTDSNHAAHRDGPSETDCDADTDLTSISSEDEGNSDDDSEGELLRQRITFHKSEGRAKSRRTDWSSSLVDREIEIWGKYCYKIDPAKREDAVFANNLLRRCEPETFKGYLEWRVKNFRIKKESTIKSYWKRLSCGYIDLTGHRITNGTELDIRDWIPTYLTPKYDLITSEKEKRAMHSHDLFGVEHAHWADDPKAKHGLTRVQFSLLLLLSAATATRPGALVESASAKGSNKALFFENIDLIVVRDTTNPARSTIAAKVNLVHIKNSGGKGRRKKFVFRLEDTLGLCIVSHILAICIAHDAFKSKFRSVEDIFKLNVPAHRQMLRLKFKKRFLTTPFFRALEKTSDGTRVSEKACRYHQYRDQFVWIGWVWGAEHTLELYDIRRGSGNLTTGERNQTMGHHGGTYEQFYMPDLIERDFQSIYFGTPAQDELIRSVARMGLSRDERAPCELTKEQKIEIYADPELVKLRAKRERCKQKLKDRGYHPLEKAQGENLYDRYTKYNRRISSLTNKLRDRRLQAAIRHFHDTIDEIEITRQLDGLDLSSEILTRPAIQYELRERAIIVQMMSTSLTELEPEKTLNTRIKFIHALASLCKKQESRSVKPSKDDRAQHRVAKRMASEPLDTRTPKRLQSTTTLRDYANGPTLVRGAPQTPEDVAVRELYPMTFRDSVCLICIGDEERSYEARNHPYARIDALKRHVDIHIKRGFFNKAFQCRHPRCSEWLKGVQHFKSHAMRVHGVSH